MKISGNKRGEKPVHRKRHTKHQKIELVSREMIGTTTHLKPFNFNPLPCLLINLYTDGSPSSVDLPFLVFVFFVSFVIIGLLL